MNIIIHFEIVECNYNHLHEEDDAKLKKKIIKELTWILHLTWAQNKKHPSYKYNMYMRFQWTM